MNAPTLSQHIQAPIAQELVDYIIDFLHDDPHSLRQCSRVCRSWLPASSLHLLRTINIILCTHEPLFVSFALVLSNRCRCEESPNWDTVHLTRTRRILGNSPRLQMNIRNLSILSRYTWGTCVTRPEWGSENPICLFDLLPSLRNLTISTTLLYSIHPPPAHLHAPREIDTLTLISTSFVEVLHLQACIGFLKCFRHISHLELCIQSDTSVYSTSEVPTDVEVLHQPLISRLEFTHHCIPNNIAHSLRWLRRTIDLTSLSTLIMNDYFPIDQSLAVDLPRFLLETTNLRSLTLNQYVFSTAAHSIPPSLRELKVNCLHDDWPDVFNDIAHVKIPLAEKITLHLSVFKRYSEALRYVRDVSNFEFPNYEGQIRAVLQSPDYSSLDPFVGRVNHVAIHVSMKRLHESAMGNWAELDFDVDRLIQSVREMVSQQLSPSARDAVQSIVTYDERPDLRKSR